MNWQQFATASPELATIGQKRLEGFGLALVGTPSQRRMATDQSGRALYRGRAAPTRHDVALKEGA